MPRRRKELSDLRLALAWALLVIEDELSYDTRDFEIVADLIDFRAQKDSVRRIDSIVRVLRAED